MDLRFDIISRSNTKTQSHELFYPSCPLCLDHLTQRTEHRHQRGVIIPQQGDQFLGGLFNPLFIFGLLFYLQDVGSQQLPDRDILGLQDVAEVAEISLRP